MNEFKFFILICFCFFSCEDNFQEIKKINNLDSFPIGIAEEIKLIYTDSAKVKAILTSAVNKDYTNQNFPYSEFPNGIKITFFDENKKKLIDLDDNNVGKIKIKKILPGKKIKSVEILVRITNDN